MATKRPVFEPGYTGVSEDAPAYFQRPGVEIQGQSALGEALSRSPTKVALAAKVGAGSVTIATSPLPDPVGTMSKSTLFLEDRAAKARGDEALEARHSEGLGRDPQGFRKQLGSLGAYIEASIPVRHMLPTQHSHQRLSSLRDLLPREVSGPAVSPVFTRPPSPAKGPHAQAVASLHASGTLAHTLTTTRATSPKAKAASPGNQSPYKRDVWTAFAVEGKPASPAGNPLSLTSPAGLGRTGSPIRPQTSTASGTVLSLPGSIRRRSPSPTSTGSSAGWGLTDSLDLAAAPPLSPDHLRMTGSGLMQSRAILRASPRHGDGKVLSGDFTLSGQWGNVIEPLKYKIPPPQRPAVREAEAELSATVGSVSEEAGPEHTFSPKDMQEVVSQLDAFEVSHGLGAAALMTRKELLEKILSARFLSLGFPTREAVLAADKEALVAAYEKLKPQAQSRPAAPLPSTLHVGGPPPVLTPRSQRVATKVLF